VPTIPSKVGVICTQNIVGADRRLTDGGCDYLGLFPNLCSDVEGGRRAGGLSRNWRHGVGSAALFGWGRRPSRSSDSLIARSVWPARVREGQARPHDREKYRISNGRRNEIRRLT
jgi:hypothetical protein